MIYHGTIVVENGVELLLELYPEDVPCTVENFVKPVKGGYYDGKTLHRVIKNFALQGGCPYGTNVGDLGYMILRETANSPHKYEDGNLSTAYRGKNTGCRQLFTCHCPQPYLGGVHTVFDKVTDNLGAVCSTRGSDVMKKVVIEEVQNG